MPLILILAIYLSLTMCFNHYLENIFESDNVPLILILDNISEFGNVPLILILTIYLSLRMCL